MAHLGFNGDPTKRTVQTEEQSELYRLMNRRTVQTDEQRGLYRLMNKENCTDR